MNWKYTSALILVILVIMLAVFFYKFNNPLARIKEDLLTYIENRTGLELSVGRAVWWPLNRFVVKDLRIGNGDNFFIRIPEVKVYYQIGNLVGDLFDDPGNWINKFTHIVIEKPDIVIGDSSGRLWERVQSAGLFKYIQKKEIYLNNGNITLLAGDSVYKLDKLNASLIRGDFKLETGVGIQNPSFTGNSGPENINLDRLLVNADFTGNSWQGKMQLETFPLSLLSELPFLSETEAITGEIKGEGRLYVEFAGSDTEIEQYRGKLTVSGGEILLNSGNYIQPIRITGAAGNIIFGQEQEEILFTGFDFKLGNSLCRFEGTLTPGRAESAKISGHFTSREFELSLFELPPLARRGFSGLSGKARVDIAVRGKLRSPELVVDFNLPRGELDGTVISGVTSSVRYRNGFFYIDRFNANINYSQRIDLSGFYDTTTRKYSFDVRGEDLELSLVKKFMPTDYTADLDYLEGRIDCDFTVNGWGFRSDRVNVLGTVELSSRESGDNGDSSYRKISSRLWMADNVIMLSEGLIQLAEGKINFGGEIALEDGRVNIQAAGKNVDTALIDKITDLHLPPISGQADFRGTLTRTLNTPRFNFSLNVDSGLIHGYSFTDLETAAVYESGQLKVNRFKLSSQGAEADGSGIVDMRNGEKRIRAGLQVKGVAYDYLGDLLARDLPLQGEIGSADIEISGSLSHPVIRGNLNSEVLALSIDNNIYRFKDAGLIFNWQRSKPLQIERLGLNGLGGRITADGEIEGDRIALNISAHSFDLTEILTDEGTGPELAASVNFDGTATGNISAPRIRGRVSGDNIEFRGQDLGELSGLIDYHDRDLVFDNLKLRYGQSEYRVEGSVEGLPEEPSLDFRISTGDGRLSDIVRVLPYDLPFADTGYVLQGAVHLHGPPEELTASLDVEAYSTAGKESRITLKGDIAGGLDLRIQGTGVRLKQRFTVEELGFDVQAAVNFRGTLTGDRNEWQLDLETGTTGAVINEVAISNIRGTINLSSGDKLELTQRVNIDSDSSLELTGEIGLEERALDINIRSYSFPLKFITESALPQLDVGGYLDGKINITGVPGNYTTRGRVYVNGKNIRAGLPQRIDKLHGTIIFHNKEIRVTGLTGTYGGQPVKLEGKILPLDRENFWDLQFSGLNLPFSSGTLDGEFDPRVRISGPLAEPLLAGELLVSNLIIGIPFKEPDYEGDSFFRPELDLTLLPGREIYIRNEYLDIAVEEGSLQLTSREEGGYDLEGRVTSNQGSFDFYNNKFIMDEGAAEFRRFAGNIPELNATAHTYVNGIKIIVNIDGPADQMVVSFNSQPELTEDEILNLLVSKGGLGEIVDDSEGGLSGFLRQELGRFLRETLQLDFVEDIEQGFKKLLELDRMEIDTYGLGFNENVSVYLGKELNEKFYLEYSRTFSLGGERGIPRNELSFIYNLDEKTKLEGSWLGEEDIRLTIETILEF